MRALIPISGTRVEHVFLLPSDFQSHKNAFLGVFFLEGRFLKVSWTKVHDGEIYTTANSKENKSGGEGLATSDAFGPYNVTCQSAPHGIQYISF